MLAAGRADGGMIMNEAHQEEYTFCPECGALAKDGGCVNCGWGKAESRPDGDWNAPEADGMTDSPYLQDGNDTQNKNAGSTDYGPQNESGFGPRTGPSYGPQNRGGCDPGTGPFYGPQNGRNPGFGCGPNGGQGPWQGQPYGQDYGGEMPPYTPHGHGPQPYGTYGAGPDKRNNTKVIAAVAITVLAVLLCLALVLIFFLVKNSVHTAVISETERQENFGIPYPDEGYAPEWYGQLPYEYDAPSEAEPEPEEEYVPSAEDDYYVTLADAVRDDLSYSVEWEEYDLTDDETGATAVGRYPRLVGGNIPQVEELNELIEREATYFTNLYNYYRSWQGENVVYNVESMGYVTYMDEEKISIVLEENYVMDGQSSISLYSINVDLISGEVLNNGRLIEYSQKLVDEFRSQNEYQNGVVDAVENMDDEQLLDFLSDENTNIVFYTPVGLEIGFNYTTSDSTGWVTATIKNYERYVTKF